MDVVAARLVLALLPLVLTPGFGYLLAEGLLDLGGGEKDLVLLLPWALWSLLYAICSFVLWRRKWSLGRSVLWSAVAATAGVLAAALLLALTGQLGVG